MLESSLSLIKDVANTARIGDRYLFAKRYLSPMFRRKDHASGLMVRVYCPVPGSDRVMTMRMRSMPSAGCKSIDVSNIVDDQTAFVSEATTVRNWVSESPSN